VGEDRLGATPMRLLWIVPGLATAALAACGSGAPPDSARPAAAKQWTIGIYAGPSPLRLAPAEGASQPALSPADVTDLAADVAAHPFLAVADGRYHLFFTVKNTKAKEGGIGWADSPDGLRWTYRKIVLDEPYDLAYPFVLRDGDEWYMIPETHTEPTLRLYRATRFPDRWTFEKELLRGDRYISASVVRFRDAWWMFVGRPGNATLRLFRAPDLKGDWTEHPRSPIVADDLNTARPAGRPLVVDGVLYRLAQDCHPTYGNRVLAFRVDEITPTAYRETPIEPPLVEASSRGWNSDAMHHVDAHPIAPNRWLAAVDALGR